MLSNPCPCHLFRLQKDRSVGRMRAASNPMNLYSSANTVSSSKFGMNTFLWPNLHLWPVVLQEGVLSHRVGFA